MVAITKPQRLFNVRNSENEGFDVPLEIIEGMTEHELRYNFQRFNGNFDELGFREHQRSYGRSSRMGRTLRV